MHTYRPAAQPTPPLPAASVEGALRFAVPVVPARHLRSMLRALLAVLGPERVADLAARANIRFTPPPNPLLGRRSSSGI